MPPHYVTTIREEIYYEYSKMICRRVYGTVDGKMQRGFITNTFKGFKEGSKTPSGTVREWEQEQKLPKQCVYCLRDSVELTTDHLVPQSRRDIDSADNVVWSCKSCNSSRGNKGIFEWLGLQKKDQLHRLVAGKYLKQLYKLHEEAGTLDVHKRDILILCSRCGLGDLCAKWNTVQKLTCFCLESILTGGS